MKWVDRWYVRSHSNPDIKYTVSRADDGKTWGCSCPHWTRHVPRPTCKHIKEVWRDMFGFERLPTVEKDEFFTEEDFTL